MSFCFAPICVTLADVEEAVSLMQGTKVTVTLGLRY